MALPLEYTPVEEIASVVDELRSSFIAGRARNIDFRIQQLKLLAYLLMENKDAFVEAFQKDLGRNRLNLQMLEFDTTVKEIIEMVQNLKSYVKPSYVSADFPFNFGKPHNLKSPRGVVLIIAPWNYPLSLMLKPVAGAIAAGNTIVMKPSETAVHINGLLTKLAPRYLDQSCYRIVNGALPQSKELLSHKWDYIFYTGSTSVGRIVAKAAAERLTPYTLELGGQCPAIVDSTASIDNAAKRICWGKTINAGQTCVSTNHVFVVKEAHDALVVAIKKYLELFFYTRGKEEQCKIISESHGDRLAKQLSASSGNIISGGGQADGYFEPTLVDGVTMSDPLMQEEIFGPILPIVSVESVDEAIKIVNSGGSPLAIYLFSQSKEVKKKVTEETQSGAVVFNDCVTHMGIPKLGFGGVGDSGQGSYWGKRTFDLFSYERAMVTVPNYLEPFLDVRYPPATSFKLNLVSFLFGVKIPFKKPDGRVPAGSSYSTRDVISAVVAVLGTAITAGFLFGGKR